MPMTSSEDEIFNQRRHRSKKAERQLEDLFDDDVSYEDEVYSDNDEFEPGELKGIFLEIFGDGSDYSYTQKVSADKGPRRSAKDEYGGQRKAAEMESDDVLDLHADDGLVLHDDDVDAYDNDQLLEELDDLADFVTKNVSCPVDGLKEVLWHFVRNYSPDYVACHLPGNYDFFALREIQELIHEYCKFKACKEKVARLLEAGGEAAGSCRMSFVHRIHRLSEMYNFYFYIKRTAGDAYAFCPEVDASSAEKEGSNGDKTVTNINQRVMQPVLPVDQFMENLFFSHLIYSPVDLDKEVDDQKMSTFLSMHPFFREKVKRMYIADGYYREAKLKISDVYDFFNAHMHRSATNLHDFSGIVKINGIELDIDAIHDFELPENSIQRNFIQFYAPVDSNNPSPINIIREKIIKDAIKKVEPPEMIRAELITVFKKICIRQMTLYVVDRIRYGAIKTRTNIFVVTEDSKMRILATDYLMRPLEYVSVKKESTDQIASLIEKHKPSHIAIVGDSVSMKYSYFYFRDNFSEGIEVFYVDDFNSIGNNYFHNNYDFNSRGGSNIRSGFDNNNDFKNDLKNTLFRHQTTQEFLLSIATRLLAPEIYFSNLLKISIPGFLQIRPSDIHEAIENGILISLAILGADFNFILKTENCLFEIMPGIRNSVNFRKTVAKLGMVTKLEDLRNIFRTEIDFVNAAVYLRIYEDYPFYHETVNGGPRQKPTPTFDILDATIVHPINYHRARIVCAAALDKDEVDDDNPNLCVEEVFKNKNILKDFVVDDRTNIQFLMLNQLIFEERPCFTGIVDDHLFLVANFSLLINFRNTYDPKTYGVKSRSKKNNNDEIKAIDNKNHSDNYNTNHNDDNNNHNNHNNNHNDDNSNHNNNNHNDNDNNHNDNINHNDNDMARLLEKIDNVLKTPAIFLNHSHVIEIFNELLNKAIFEATVHKKLDNCTLLLIGKSNIFVKHESVLYPNEVVHVVLEEMIYHSLSFSGHVLKTKNRPLRLTQHPIFRPLNSKEAEQYLCDENKLVVLRMSSSGQYGVFTVRLDDTFVHFRVDELYVHGNDYKNRTNYRAAKGEGYMGGTVYLLNNKNYESIDAILDRFFYPFMKTIQSLTESPLYKSVGKISTEFSHEYPGYLQIRCKNHMEFLKISEKGIVYSDMIFRSVEEYIQFRIAASKKQVC